jgi:hypothetical protein
MGHPGIGLLKERQFLREVSVELSGFKFLSLSYQSSFHLSLTVLVCSRFFRLYLTLEEIYLPYSYCITKQYYSLYTNPIQRTLG